MAALVTLLIAAPLSAQIPSADSEFASDMQPAPDPLEEVEFFTPTRGPKRR